MARQIHRLSARKVATETKPGRHPDGGGLYLSLSKNGGRRWVFLYRRNGKLREMGLGSARDVPLARAREAAGRARQQLAAGYDPLAARKTAEGAALTFKDCATAYIDAKRAGWSNEKHASQWANTLETYVYPEIGALPVDQVSVGHIAKILTPIWSSKTETASRVRSRMENILDWAKAREYRTGENPARWRGHLENLFPKRSQVQVVEHHPALPYQELPGFLLDLRKREAIAASSLEFLILTAARTEEVIEAPWHEINFKEKLWTIPAKRMKGKRIHRVPLTPSALAVLRRMKSLPGVSEQDYIFPGAKPPDPQSNNAMLALLERMKRDDITVHGFRSTFRDWAAEETNFPNHVVEMAMAHTIKSKVEGAYRRGELLEKRRALMIAWAAFCDRVRSGNVVSISQK